MRALGRDDRGAERPRRLIWQAKDWGNLALVLVGMICISIVVLLADKLANMLERLLLPWERHQRS